MVCFGRNRTARARSLIGRRVAIICVIALVTLHLAATRLSAAGNGSVSGTVADPSGAVVPGATVTLTNTALGTMFTAVTDGKGLYTFPSIAVGRYDLLVELSGFKSVKRSGLAVDADSRLQADVKLELVGQAETVTVSASVDEVRVERASTQLGEVVSAEKMTELSLNGRSYTDLLPIQPGITPVTTMKPNSIIMAGVTGAIEPSGELNPGNVSINGQRESAFSKHSNLIHYSSTRQ